MARPLAVFSSAGDLLTRMCWVVTNQIIRITAHYQVLLERFCRFCNTLLDNWINTLLSDAPHHSTALAYYSTIVPMIFSITLNGGVFPKRPLKDQRSGHWTTQSTESSAQCSVLSIILLHTFSTQLLQGMERERFEFFFLPNENILLKRLWKVSCTEANNANFQHGWCGLGAAGLWGHCTPFWVATISFSVNPNRLWWFSYLISQSFPNRADLNSLVKLPM